MSDFTHNNSAYITHSHPIADLADKLTDRIRSRRERRELHALQDLDDHLLKDVGLTRDDLERTLNLPQSIDASTELHRIAYLNRTSGM